MDEYADIYYVDTRNATNDHRTGGGPVVQGGGQWRPAPPARTVYVPGRPVASFTGPAPVIYAQPPTMASTLFGKLTTGQVIEMVAQIFAALQPLPAAPNATRDANTDVANGILYQTALAQHAKRDEQVRTVGNLVARLVG